MIDRKRIKRTPTPDGSWRWAPQRSPTARGWRRKCACFENRESKERRNKLSISGE